jgi:hypothetical protein
MVPVKQHQHELRDHEPTNDNKKNAFHTTVNKNSSVFGMLLLKKNAFDKVYVNSLIDHVMSMPMWKFDDGIL